MAEATDGLAVAVVLPGDPSTTSGGFQYDRRLVAGLRAAGATVRVFSVPWRRYPLGVVDTLGLATGVPQGLREADVVVVDELAHPGTAGLVRRLRRGGTPVVALVHHLRCAEGGRFAPVARRLERTFLRGCSAAVCVSAATERDVRDLVGDGLPTHLAAPPADQFAPDVTRDDVARRARESPLRVVALGSLVPRKGHPTLVRALAGVDPAVDWHLAVVGPEPDAAHATAVRDLVDGLGVDDRVTFHGKVPGDHLADVLRRSHVLALPSTYEGFGMAYLEGMGFGLPAVATAAGGADAVVTDGVDGFLVDPGDVGGVREALTTLATDRERLAAMGRAALDRFDAHPEWSDTVAGVRSFLASVVADPEVPDGG
ncbi:glycosyltransferase family 4 protein [Halobaculum marinum]|uniref:Glycosyltransferase family 4 protein n=1 Tax=Halobaculum marinum TaxID=3031996 RepID=A0ABD5WUD6_9EURY|nr:glycosyltransferase family 4 protein [Halobaculum sp. DT55]